MLEEGWGDAVPYQVGLGKPVEEQEWWAGAGEDAGDGNVVGDGDVEG